MTDTHSTAPTPHVRRRWRLSALSLVIAVVSLVGTSVALYPATASWFSALQQAKQVAAYTEDVKLRGPASRLDALDKAHAYNAALMSGAEVRAGKRVPDSGNARLPSGFDYGSLLSADQYGLMGRILIPSIGVDLPIYHGTGDQVLENGVGHLEGSSLPVGGEGTHAVLAGHRGLASSTLFTDLDRVADGQTFTLSVFGETLNYKVVDIRVVDPDQTRTLAPVPGKDLVTLVTCTPIGINSQRILVTGERVLPTPTRAEADAAATPAGPGFPWWSLVFGSAVLLVALYLWWSGLPVRRRRRRRRSGLRARRGRVGVNAEPVDG